jgi:hypothetical protein
MILCDVYKGTKREGLYIYVDRSVGLKEVPDALLSRFGTPQLALSFKLTIDRPLAKEDPEKVIEAIRENGFFLQLPPNEQSL